MPPNSEVCHRCHRQVALKKDGTFKKHRPIFDTFSGPYCPGGNEAPR